MPTWENWLQTSQGPDRAPTAPVAVFLDLPQTVRGQEWKPTAADRKQAWEFYTELRTRITTQPLHYTEGDEPTALKSVADLFAMSRDLIRKGGPESLLGLSETAGSPKYLIGIGDPAFFCREIAASGAEPAEGGSNVRTW